MSDLPPGEQEERNDRRAALLLIPMLLLGGFFCVYSLFADVGLGEADSFVPAPLHSIAVANYGEDDLPGRLRSLHISIIEFTIKDRDPEGGDPETRLTEVMDSMKSPVPTVTPRSDDATQTPVATSSHTPAPSRTPTATHTLDPLITPSATPTASTTPTPSRTPTITMTPTFGPSPTPSKTPTPGPCKVPPYIEIIAPYNGQRFDMNDRLPGQAFAFDPDNVNPLTCSTAATFPDDDGDGLPGDPEVEMRIEWWSGSSWVLVHTELESEDPYCAFSSCSSHDLSTGTWPDPPDPPINPGLHRLKAKVLQDDEGVPSGWAYVNFYIDPLPTAAPSSTPILSQTPSPVPLSPTPSNTSLPSPVPSNTPAPVCPDFKLSWGAAGGNHVRWDLENEGSSTVWIQEIEFQWPSGTLEEVRIDSTTIASPYDPDFYWNQTWGSADSARSFSPSQSKSLRFNLSTSPSGTYQVTVHSNNGCTDTDIRNE